MGCTVEDSPIALRGANLCSPCPLEPIAVHSHPSAHGSPQAVRRLAHRRSPRGIVIPVRSSTAAPTRLPGVVLVVVLLTGSILGPSPVSAAGEPAPVGVWPLSPVPTVEQRFDPPTSPWGAGHRGVDLLGRSGATVVAALAGRVGFAGVLAGRGVVVVDHGGTRTTYEPVTASVHVGDTVAAGSPLGTLTAVRSHCPPAACLHWGWIRNADDVYLDPLLLVGAGAVRLLPLWRDRPAGAASAAIPPVARAVSPYAGWRPFLDLLR